VLTRLSQSNVGYLASLIAKWAGALLPKLPRPNYFRFFAKLRGVDDTRPLGAFAARAVWSFGMPSLLAGPGVIQRLT
jgi:hypothetical protein